MKAHANDVAAMGAGAGVVATEVPYWGCERRLVDLELAHVSIDNLNASAQPTVRGRGGG